MIAAAIVIGAAVYGQLPPRVDSHWNANNQVDGTMDRLWGAFLMPLISLALLGLLLLLPVIDPLRANIQLFRRSFNVFIVLIIAFLLYLHILTIMWNLGLRGFQMSTALLPALGLLFIFMGSLLRSARRNFTIGIRTPWTLASDRVWDRTHRLGARLFYLCGLIAILGALLPGPAAFVVVIGPVLLVSLFLVIYSYLAWRAEQTGA
jgi:uncharacterized membrane protein